MSIGDNILEAIDIILDKKMSDASFDKTIEAKIMTCIDLSSGRYKLKYQDSIIYANASGDEKYSNGAMVYVHVPENNMSKEKTILGLVKKLGNDYVTIIPDENYYEFIGINSIKNNGKFSLISYKGIDRNTNYQEITLYDKNNNINIINYDEAELNCSFKQSSYFCCGGEFQTTLSPEQQRQGNFGLVFTIVYKNDNNEDIEFSYAIDINNMTGNPYLQEDFTEQYRFFELDKNFQYIKKIIFFKKDFPLTDNTITIPDIFVQKLKLIGCNRLPESQLDSYYLSISCLQGLYFDNSNISDKHITAEIKLRGEKVNLAEIKDTRFYWFEEKGDVFKGDPLKRGTAPEYNDFGGIGWRCLNEYEEKPNEYNESNTEIISPAHIEWLPHNNSFIINKNSAFTRVKNYKCVAVINGVTLTKEFTVYNNNTDYLITLKSERGESFTDKDNSSTILTCTVSPVAQYIYQWSAIDRNGLSEQILSNNPSQNSYEVKLGSFTNYKIFKCTVYGNDNRYLGTEKIKLTKFAQELVDYWVEINNGLQFFLYDENGVAPTSASLTDRLILDELSYTFHDEINNRIITSTDPLNPLVAEWLVPEDKTLLKINGSPSKIEDGFKVYNAHTLSYTLVDKYSIKNIKNQIILSVTYNGKTVTAKTSFTFAKQGEQGTNGTNVVCRIVPNEENYVVKRYYTITKLPNNIYKTNFNIFPANNSNWFKVELWQNGELLNLDDADIKLDFLKDNARGYSNFLCNNNTLSINNIIGNYTEIERSHPNNILQAIVTMGEGRAQKKYYSTLPIVTIDLKDASYSIEVDEDSGYNYVLYHNDGTSPSYSQNPFTLKIQRNGTIVTNATYQWKPLGGYYTGIGNSLSFHKAESYKGDYSYDFNEPKNFTNTTFNITPKSRIMGNQTTTAVYCEVKVNNKVIATVHIPVHMYLNRYSNAALNDWDGNSIKLNENEGYILAPQIGAGKKDNNNRFTGVVMGEVWESDISESNRKIGLLGYSEGKNSFYLNAKNGSASFGTADTGTIELNPSSKNLIIQSGGAKAFSTSNKTGMQINLSKPEIIFGNGNFSVNSEGILTAKGASIQGDFEVHIEDNDAGGSGDFYFTKRRFKMEYKDGSGNRLYMTPRTFTMENIYSEQGLYYNSGRLNINGSFYTKILDGNEKVGEVSFDTSGISMWHKNGLNDFKLGRNLFRIGKLDSSTGLYEKGLEYNNGDLTVTGTINALAGTIGGWTIENRRICSIRQVIYKGQRKNITTMSMLQNGSIDGYFYSESNSDTVEAGSISTHNNREKSELKAGVLNFYYNPNYENMDDDLKNNPFANISATSINQLQGRIYTRDKNNISDYNGVSFTGALTVSSRGQSPLLLCASSSANRNGEIVAALFAESNEDKRHIVIPYWEKNTEGNADASNNEINETSSTGKHVSELSTKIYNNKIMVRNLHAYRDIYLPSDYLDKYLPVFTTPEEEEEEVDIEEEENENTDIEVVKEEKKLSELFKVFLDRPNKIKYIAQEDDDYDIIESIHTKNGEVEKFQQYKIYITGRGTIDETVTHIELSNGKVINLEGF